MSKVQVFDPPMCCSTGVCGPEVDPALVRFAADLEWLKSKGVEVERFNLSQGPAAFLDNPVVAQAMRERADALPMLIVDGKVAAQGRYPDRGALAAFVGAKLEAEPAPAACCPPREAAPVGIAKPSSNKKCC
jgi:hypothetical protein